VAVEEVQWMASRSSYFVTGNFLWSWVGPEAMQSQWWTKTTDCFRVWNLRII